MKKNIKWYNNSDFMLMVIFIFSISGCVCCHKISYDYDYEIQKAVYEHRHDSIQKLILDLQSKAKLNGFKCPDCGSNLMDTQPNLTLSTYPAQKSTNCSKCDYVGYRTL